MMKPVTIDTSTINHRQPLGRSGFITLGLSISLRRPFWNAPASSVTGNPDNDWMTGDV